MSSVIGATLSPSPLPLSPAKPGERVVYGRLARGDDGAQRGDPAFGVGAVVEIGAARGAAVGAGRACDQVDRDLDALTRVQAAPVEHDLAAADLEVAHDALPRSLAARERRPRLRQVR